MSDAQFKLPNTRGALITDELRRLIQSGELPPGQRLRQAEIASRFGVSTTPVREAFTALAREGLVLQDAHRGVVVFKPELSDLHENYEIRGALEPLATELAAPKLTEDHLAALDTLLDRMRREKDRRRYHRLNREFHAEIYSASGRLRLAAMIESLRDAAEAYFSRLDNAAASATDWYPRQVQAEHEAIAEALRRRDSARARQLMAEHLEHNRLQLEKLVGDPDEVQRNADA